MSLANRKPHDLYIRLKVTKKTVLMYTIITIRDTTAYNGLVKTKESRHCCQGRNDS